MKTWLICLSVTSFIFIGCEKSDTAKSEGKEGQMAEQENLTPDQQFLVDNGKKEDVVQTPSGLQYKVLTEGSGAKPTATDQVTVHYRGSLIDGTEFDSSYKRNQPISFALNRVIPGWTEGLQLMSTGGKYEFYIPSDLGYGDRGAPGSPIGPGATLIFEVELLEVN